MPSLRSITISVRQRGIDFWISQRVVVAGSPGVEEDVDQPAVRHPPAWQRISALTPSG